VAIPGLSGIWQLARRVENIFQDVEKLVRGVAALRDELRDLEKRVATLEGREELLVEKAKGAVAGAASAVVMQSVADMARRIGALEAGGQRRLE
jgi:phage shock protein A